MRTTSLKNYTDTPYTASSIYGVDRLTVFKHSQSDWCHIELNINEGSNKTLITLRSKSAAESLHFMLSQMLRGSQ
jgi:hypothetical protein